MVIVAGERDRVVDVFAEDLQVGKHSVVISRLEFNICRGDRRALRDVDIEEPHTDPSRWPGFVLCVYDVPTAVVVLSAVVAAGDDAEVARAANLQTFQRRFQLKDQTVCKFMISNTEMVF